MSELFEKSIRTLELPAVLELLARHAVSDEAKARCLRLRPATDAAAVEHLLMRRTRPRRGWACTAVRPLRA